MHCGEWQIVNRCLFTLLFFHFNTDQFHLEIEGTGSNRTQGLPMVQGAVAAVGAWTALVSELDRVTA